jgi:hypothetical protein
MSNEKQILNAIIKEDFHTANKLIKESLLLKLGNALEEKLVDFAPTVFNEGNLTPKQKKHIDKNKNGKIDGEDFKLLRKENTEDPEMEDILESFETEILSLVEEVQAELGQQLSEDEIMELANLYLEMMENDSDVVEDDQDVEEDEYPEDEDEFEQSQVQPNIRQSGVEY